MTQRFFFSFFVLLVAVVGAHDKPEDWLEIRSAHFVVVSNAGPKQAQNVADQFERMRALFQKALPRLESDDGSPIMVLAVKNEKDFRALEPAEYLARGQLKLAGYFLRASDKNFVLVRTDAEGEHPFSIVYHEYTHFVTRKAAGWMPLWLNEGLAEFYQNTDIRDKDPVIGQPSRENIMLLRQTRLLPLPALFAADHNSPYYHEENKGSIFYAESWALTHYLIMRDHRENTSKLMQYAEQVSQKVDPVKAATLTFGDLNELQKELEVYVRQPVFTQLKLRGALAAAEADFKVRPMTFAESAAVRAEFLAYLNRAADALELAEAVLKENPNSALGHEVMGYLKFRQGEIAEARNWYGKAVKLNSQSFLAHYYFATIAMSAGRGESPEDDAQVESSLRTAIKLNPQFAPAYDRLGVFFGMRQKNLDEAHILALQALTIDPSNVAYWLNDAMILRTNRRDQDAIRVMRNALKVAQSPADTARVQNALEMAERYEAAEKAYEEQSRRANEEESAAKLASVAPEDSGKMEETAPSPLHRTEARPQGPQRTVIGTIKDVKCSSPAKMEFKIESQQGPVALHADNYYKIQFSAFGFNPEGELHPCSDLEGMSARVKFVEGSSKPGEVTAVELRK